MEPGDDDLERRLDRALRDLDGAAESICRGEELADLASIERALSLQPGDLEDLLARLMTEPSTARQPGSRDDLTRLTAERAEHSAERLGTPVTVRMLSREPVPVNADDRAEAAVQRLLDIAVGHAGWCGRVDIATRLADSVATVELTSWPGEAGDRDPATVQERCRSLAEFVREIGGRLAITPHSDGMLGVRLELRAEGGAGEPGNTVPG